jgi:hypothetical protein
MVVMRGGKKPEVVDLNSKTDEASGVIAVLLIPICANESPELNKSTVAAARYLQARVDDSFLSLLPEEERLFVA